MTAATAVEAYPAADLDPIEVEADDGLNWRCGSGDRDALGEGCDVWLPRRRLCDRHRAAILVAAVRARVDTAPVRAYATKHPEAGPMPVEHRNGIRRVPVPVRAAQLARLVRARGHRVSRDEAADALGMTTGGSISRSIRHARDAGWIISVTGPDGGLSPGDVVPPAAAE